MTEADATAQVEAGTTLFTLGITGPDYDIAAAKKWVAWRDSMNAGR